MVHRSRPLIALVIAGALSLLASRADLVPPISADSLRDDIVYLSSDALEGRLTPSHGLDLAAGYIADKFRRAGLDPAAPQYFQSAKFDQARVNLEGFELALVSNAKQARISRDEVRVESLSGLDLSGATAIKLPENGVLPAVTGKIVIGEERRYADEMLLNELEARKPALILIVGRTNHEPPSPLAPDPNVFLGEEGNTVPLIRIHSSQALDLFQRGSELMLSLHLAKPTINAASVSNVVGVLPGSDPQLAHQYVLLTAHYDHMGRSARGVFRGANDNASGTASLIAIAGALAGANPHPKRSIIFMAMFGEEEGLLGSYFYTRHPLVPLRDTVADINLEQLGRTDDTGGRRIAQFGLTGPSFSNVPNIMSDAAKDVGISVYNRKDADDYFDRSDNYAFAQFGIVSHTAAVAFEFNDYHTTGDTPNKIDYSNLAAVDRGIAAGIVAIANAIRPPHWSASPKARVYIDAGR